MSNNITSDPASPAPAPSAPKIHRAVANQAIQNYIGDSETFLLTVKNDPEIAPAMEGHGYDAAELTTGDNLLHAAADAFGVRLTGIAGKSDKQSDLVTAEKTAHDDYAQFRAIARANFPDQADRAGLGLTGSVPHDLQKFTTLSFTSYTNAGKDPWATKMTKRGYTALKLNTLKDGISALSGTDSDKARAAGDAQKSTESRDAAYEALKDYMKEIMGTARGAFRGNAGALTKLKL
jgi:hypothetical protein